MKTKNYLFLLKVIFCLLSLPMIGGFLFAEKKPSKSIPEWVTNPAKAYPGESFFYYVGEGSERSKAELNAVNGIASIFGQSVKSDTASSKKMAQAKMHGKVATVSVSGFSQDILRSVDSGNLIGVETKDFFFDGTVWYAIAVLDKTKAAAIYRQLIVKNAKAIKELLENSENDTYSLESYSAYDFASDIATENESYYKKLSVIDASAFASLKVNVPSSKEIAAQKLEIAKNIPIAVVIHDDVSGKLAAAFTEALASIGFRASLTANVRYVLTGNLTFEESQSSDGKAARCRYFLESYILDSATDQRLAPLCLSGRESHVSYHEAENRALKTLEKKIRGDFKNTFVEYLKNFTGE